MHLWIALVLLAALYLTFSTGGISETFTKEPTHMQYVSVGWDEGKCALRTPGFDCKYRTRQQGSDGTWKCPPGWTDTNCDWNDGSDIGKFQCVKCPCKVMQESGPFENNTQVKKAYFSNAWAKKRLTRSGYVCPKGYTDTKCDKYKTKARFMKPWSGVECRGPASLSNRNPAVIGKLASSLLRP